MPRLSMLFLPSSRKAGNFEWDPDQDSTQKQVQAMAQAVLPLEPYTPAAPVITKIPVTGRISHGTSGKLQ